jgi:Skp family chaperone for outer membrane proteins
MKLLLLTLALLLASPALAQENMPHPRTGQPGAWIPRSLQLDHLKLEKEAEACKELQEKREEQLEKKDEEIEERKAALEEEKEASQALAQVLTGSELELTEEKKKNNRLTHWLWGTGSVATVATVILVLVVAL